jgi:hypothetical protein
MPSPQLPPGHWQVTFTWEFEDPDMSGRGEAVARFAAPDSVRLDFFLAGGFGGGAAILIGDSLQLPSMEIFRRLIPPAPLLWASLGRAALPNSRDTVVALDGPVLRAQIGRPAEWRVEFRGDSLRRVERVQRGRMLEWVQRDSASIRYRHETARRSLSLRLVRPLEPAVFDASIWQFTR